MGAVVEVLHDKKGIVWPLSIAPFAIHLLALSGGEKEAGKLYQELQKKGYEVFYDDRKTSSGEKLVDADLLGIPLRVVVSEKTLAKKSVEVKKRSEEKGGLVRTKDLLSKLET